MIAVNLHELYEKYIRTLPAPEQLRLAEMITRNVSGSPAAPRRSLLELEGLGQHIWQGLDPQQYVDELRDEWERRT